jgi:hypothetical protein
METLCFLEEKEKEEEDKPCKAGKRKELFRCHACECPPLQ